MLGERSGLHVEEVIGQQAHRPCGGVVILGEGAHLGLGGAHDGLGGMEAVATGHEHSGEDRIAMAPFECFSLRLEACMPRFIARDSGHIGQKYT